MPGLVLQREPTTVGKDTDAGRVLNNFGRIEALVNGNLDQDNAAANAPVVVVTTLAGLVARVGKRVLLRATDYVELNYQEDLARWVSDEFRLTKQNGVWTELSFSAMVDANPSAFASCWIPNFKALYDAGLRPQMRLSGFLGSDSPNLGGYCIYQIELRQANDGDTTLAALGSIEILVGDGGGSGDVPPSYFIDEWRDVTISAPGESHVIAFPRIEWAVGGAGSSRWDSCEARLRWVST